MDNSMTHRFSEPPIISWPIACFPISSGKFACLESQPILAIKGATVPQVFFQAVLVIWPIWAPISTANATAPKSQLWDCCLLAGSGPLVKVARLHRLRSVHLQSPRIPREILWTRTKPAVCRWYSCSSFCRSLHIKRQHDGVHAIMPWHSQCVGWRGFLDGFDCFGWLTAQRIEANIFQLRLPEHQDWSSVWFAQEVNQLIKDLGQP